MGLEVVNGLISVIRAGERGREEGGREGGTDARPPKGWLELDLGQGERKDSRHHHDTHTHTHTADTHTDALAVNSPNYRHTEMVTF